MRGALIRMALHQYRRARAALNLTRVARGMIARVRVLKRRVKVAAARNKQARAARRDITKKVTAENRERRRLAEEERREWRWLLSVFPVPFPLFFFSCALGCALLFLSLFVSFFSFPRSLSIMLTCHTYPLTDLTN